MGQDRFRRMYWVLPYGGSLYIEGNQIGDSGLDNFAQDISKSSEEHSTVDNSTERTLGEPHVFSPGLTRCIDEMNDRKLPTGESSGNAHHYRGFHGNQMAGARAEPSPMKLLMQHVSSQGKPSNGSSSSALKSPTQDSRNHLIQTSSKSDSASAGSEHQKSSIGTPNRTVIVTEGPTGPWFNLLPREPCDKTTITNCWMPTINTSRVALDGNVQRRPGRPPKQAKVSDSECTTSVTKTGETEVVMPPPSSYQLPSLPRPLTLDEVRRSVMESLRQDPAAIPEGLCV